MALNIVSNYAANVAHRNLTGTDKAASASLAKLSSGQRIVQAKDDAAALAIGMRLSGEVMALKQAGVNAGQAASMLQIADGAMARVGDVLNRMKALAVQASSGQLSDTERTILNTEYTALKDEIIRIGNDTEFNGVKLTSEQRAVTLSTSFDSNEGLASIDFNGLSEGDLALTTAVAGTGTNAGDVTLSGTNDGVSYSGTVAASAFDTNNNLTAAADVTLTGSDGSSITLSLNTNFANDATAGGTGTIDSDGVTTLTFKVGSGIVATEDDLEVGIDSLVEIGNGLSSAISTEAAANTASGQVTDAITDLATARANIGASQSRLDFAQSNISTAVENAEAARSQLLDLDVAAEISAFTSKQVLMQAGVSMLAQANQMPQNLLRLFQ